MDAGPAWSRSLGGKLLFSLLLLIAVVPVLNTLLNTVFVLLTGLPASSCRSSGRRRSPARPASPRPGGGPTTTATTAGPGTKSAASHQALQCDSVTG